MDNSNVKNSELQSNINLFTKNNNTNDNKNKHLLLIGIITFIFLSILAYFFYNLNNQEAPFPDTPTTDSLKQDETASPTNDPTKEDMKSSEQIANKIIFLKDPNPDYTGKYQLWVMDTDGTNLEQIDNIGEITKALKRLDDTKIFLIRDDRENFYVYDLEKGKEEKYNPISHTEPNVQTDLNFNFLNDISPDNNYILLNVTFNIPCDINLDIIPEDLDAPIGFAPCQPDYNPDYPEGTYLYDISTDRTKYLDEYTFGHTWDLDSNTFYFNKDGLYKVDLSTLEIEKIFDSQTFGFTAYPIPNSDKFILFDGTINNSAQELSTSELSIVDQDLKVTKKIFEGRWADIQPFVSFSPNNEKFIYSKTNNIGDGYPHDYLNLYNISTQKDRQLTYPSTQVSYDPNGVWVDNNSYITLARSDEKDFTKRKSYIVKIDIDTGEITKLTEPGNIIFSN